jgi:hypothetical protein
MQTAPGYRQCAGFKANGALCGSPALRGSSLCFFHDPAARERHQAARLALRPNPRRLALHDLVRAWPSHHVSSDRRRLLECAFTMAANLAEEVEAEHLRMTQNSQSSSAKTVI